MSSIVLVDTSILLNVLDVEGRNDLRDEVFDELGTRIEAGDHLFIPLAAIIETGNHIAHVANGAARRSAAKRFVDAVQDALNSVAPWKPLNFPDHTELGAWLQAFPDSATRQIGMGDVSIQHEWKQLCAKFPMSSVAIWSVDEDLQGYEHAPARRTQRT
jgi:hypothetical protein